MALDDTSWLPKKVFPIDVQKLRQGWYTDAYFTNIVRIMERLTQEGYTFQGQAALKDLDCSKVETGELEVEMQFFSRRKPLGVIVGIEEALSILKECCGYFDQDGIFINTYDQLEVEAVPEGTIVEYNGDPLQIKPILRIKGQYRYFAMLETPILGVLTESTRIATNVFQALKAANGKSLLFFPARFSHYCLQAVHGYAYKIAVDVYNKKYTKECQAFVSTEAQAQWWEAHGSGTTAHAYIAVFLGDTVETMLQFARILSPQIPRIALVDFHNDCVGETIKVLEAMFREFYRLKKAGEDQEAERYKLFGVRMDTSGNMVDKSIQPLGNKKLDCGVNPRLVWNVKKALQETCQNWTELDQEGRKLARRWCQEIKIVATGGFNAQRIGEFEQLGVPVDLYGVGSSLLSNCSHCETTSDFTADIVQVKINNQWEPLAKIGRKASNNPDLKRIN